ncbi:MAG TPA: Ig-like domain-containing protein [Gemmatimonadales bacterium]|nr:Ig-like domain-containing protein [Gemmatimonadales bacterium]
MAPVPGRVASIRVAPDSVSIRVGHTLQMSAVVLDSAGDTLSNRSVAWHSSDTSKVVISTNGLATARGYGPVTITATSDSVSGTAALRVLVPIARIDIRPFSAVLVPGGSIQYTAVLTGVDGNTLSDREIIWNSQAPGTTTVSAIGIATAAGMGQTAVTASSEGVTSSPSSITVTRPSFVSLFSGESSQHTCGVTAAGAVFCWGENLAGALGNGTITDSGVVGGLSYPTGVLQPGAITALATGDGFSCAVTAPSGVTYCWGAGDHNKLGNGSLENRLAPWPIIGGLFASGVAAEHKRGCLLATDSLAYCWGDTQQSPTAVPGARKFTALAGGQGGPAFCGLGVDSLAYCGFIAQQFPQPVPGGVKFVALTVGFQHACGVGADSLAYCWGQNSSGQLGDSTTTFRSTPAPVAGPVRFAALAAGGTFTCGLDSTGTAYCWGANDVGQLGSTTSPISLVPAAVSGGQGYSQLTAGSSHACGVTTGGVAYCWGWNAYGQLGDGSKTDRSTPVRVQGQP